MHLIGNPHLKSFEKCTLIYKSKYRIVNTRTIITKYKEKYFFLIIVAFVLRIAFKKIANEVLSEARI
jgi:hypothetical protein